jgi:hypothetical protein
MWYNPIVILILKSPLHAYFSRSTLLLEFEGRKTGKRYTLPVSYVQDEEDYLVLSLKKRRWWKNLEGGVPFTARIRGRKVSASADVYTAVPDVARELGIFLSHLQWLAKHLDVHVDNDNKPVQADLEKTAEKRVVIRIHPD